MAERRGLGRGLGALIRDDEDAIRANEELASRRSGGGVGVGDGADRSGRPVDLYFGGGDGQRRSDISALLSPPVRRGKRDSESVSRETEGVARKAKAGRTAGNRREQGVGVDASKDSVSRETESKAAADAAKVDSLGTKETRSEVGRGSTVSRETGGTRVSEVCSSGAAHNESADEGYAQSAVNVSRETDEIELVAVPGVYLAMLSPDVIVPNAKQPRQVFVEAEVQELAASIREVGLLQPIVVRPLDVDDVRRHHGQRVGAPEGTDEVIAGEYELIMGERRLRASQIAGMAQVPAIVRSTSDEDMLRDALLENLHRSQLNALEEAAAYEQLLREFGCSQEELSRRIARSRPHISNTMRLLKLPGTVQKRVADSRISAGHARALLGLSDSAAMESLAERIENEGLSVRAVEELVAMGDERPDARGPYRPRRAAANGAFTALDYQLASRFATRVKVTMGARKGKISIDFRDAQDLERILAVLSPEIEYKAPVVTEPDGEATGNA